MTPQSPDMHRQPCPPHSASSDDLPQQAVALAERLLHTARQEQTAAEQEQAARLARMMADPAGKELTIALVDQAFRSHHPDLFKCRDVPVAIDRLDDQRRAGAGRERSAECGNQAAQRSQRSRTR